MIKKLFLLAALLAPGLAYAGNPSANLSAHVVPAGSGSGALPGSILPPCPGGCTWSIGFDDEFNGNGSPGYPQGDSRNGVDWTKWFQPYADDTTAWSYSANTVTDCKDTVFESGGYLHILPWGTVDTHNGGFACEINTH